MRQKHLIPNVWMVTLKLFKGDHIFSNVFKNENNYTSIITTIWFNQMNQTSYKKKAGLLPFLWLQSCVSLKIIIIIIIKTLCCSSWTCCYVINLLLLSVTSQRWSYLQYTAVQQMQFMSSMSSECFKNVFDANKVDLLHIPWKGY